MARYLMLAFNGPVEGAGNAERLERWYEQEHIPGIYEDEEVLTARRYKVLNSNMPGVEAWPYVAVYEMETEDTDALMQRLQEKLGDIDPSLDTSRSATVLAIKVCGED